jgi:hypothetical protein
MSMSDVPAQHVALVEPRLGDGLVPRHGTGVRAGALGGERDPHLGEEVGPALRSVVVALCDRGSV